MSRLGSSRFSRNTHVGDTVVIIKTPIERKTLAAAQTIVIFSTINVKKSDIFLTSISGDGRRLLLDTDYTETSSSTIELTNSYPEGTICFADETSVKTATFSESDLVKKFDIEALAIADAKIKIGDSLNIKEKSTGIGGGADWDAVLLSAVTPNADDILALNGGQSPALAMVRRDDTRLEQTVNANKTNSIALNHPKPPTGDDKTKLTIWRSADKFDIVSVVQGSQNQCVLQSFEQGITTTASSVGGPGEHYRLTFAMRLTDVYVGSTQPTAQAAGVTTAISDIRDNLGAESGGGTSFDNNNLFRAFDIPQNDTIEFLCGTFDNTPRQQVKSNVAFIVDSPGGSTDVLIELSDGAGTWKTIKNVNLLALANTTADSLVRIDLDIPAGTRKIRVTNLDTGQCHCCGANIYRLHEIPNHDMYLDTWAYWRTASHLYTNTSGASDYAIFDHTQGKFMGSFHGGETRNLLRLFFDDEASISVIPTSGFKLFNRMNMLQEIDIDGQLTNNAIYDYSTSGTLVQQFSMTGSVNVRVFYTNMMTTNPLFRQVWWPFFNLPTIDSLNYPLGNVNTVTQREAGASMSIRSTFSQFQMDDNKALKGSYIWNNINYSKLYNPIIDLPVGEFVTVTDISFIQIKEFF